MRGPMSPKIARALIPFVVSLGGAAVANGRDLADLDLETLMDMEVNVTSVSKKSARLAESAGAVTVITRDDLRRLGVTQLPEALRTVPGLDVARINGNVWAISSRGFNQQYANKLLVLVDGRSVFTPAFGGVYWDVQDLLIEDIDRIEVIRGPGATLWGSNAVNGVINITTRLAGDTQGGLVTTAASSESSQVLGFRYGGELSDTAQYRTYAKLSNSDGFSKTPDGTDSSDGSRSYRAGFRSDWNRADNETLTFQAEGYLADQEERVALPLYTAPFSESFESENVQTGASLLGRWTRTPSESSHTSLQAYVEHSRHEAYLTIERRDTFDIQWEHRFRAAAAHDVIWGVGYRFSEDDFNTSPLVQWFPSSRSLNLFTMFAQDEVALTERLSLTVGSKVEHNDYTGVEVQPSVRLRWIPRDGQTAWAAVSRAVSTPTRLFRGTRIVYSTLQPSPFSPVIELVATGSDDVESEKVLAYEIGYRLETSARFSLDLATFYNRYKGVTSANPSSQHFELTPVPHLVVERAWTNDTNGNTYGAEASMQWQPIGAWRLTATYSYLKTQLEGDDEFYANGSPSQQASLRSYVNLPADLQLSTAAYYVDRIESILGAGSATIPAYVRLDTGLTWSPRASLQLGVWGQNLLDGRHAEYTRFESNVVTEVPRTFLLRANWQF
jgi:iron complex outermembrane recepter protein